jgi:hypothetical protein
LLIDFAASLVCRGLSVAAFVMTDTLIIQGNFDAAQSMVITLFKGQRDQLVTDLRRFAEFVKQQ